jgi:predicted ATPase
LAPEARSRTIRAALCRERQITFSILPDLTDQHLEKIGVASLGHRLQLLRAIAELRGAPERGAAAATPAAPHDAAERRHRAIEMDIVEGRVQLYDPVEHRPLATKFGQDIGVANLFNRSMALWLLGYANAARTDTEHVLNDARKCGQAATLMFALSNTAFSHTCYGDYAKAHAQADELVTLADEKRALLWKARAMMFKGLTLSLMGKASSAIQMMTSGIAAARSTGSKLWVPLYQADLARAYATLGQLDDAWRCLGEAMTVMEATKETWCEAEVNRIAGEIALWSPKQDTAKAESYFERALAVARQQQAKSWELRAAMSMARLLRDQGRRREARELLAPVYGWFTEGFDTLDLKEAKALLDELAA